MYEQSSRNCNVDNFSRRHRDDVRLNKSVMCNVLRADVTTGFYTVYLRITFLSHTRYKKLYLTWVYMRI